MVRACVSTGLAIALLAIVTSPLVNAVEEPAEPEATPAPVAVDRPPLPSRSATMAADLLRQLPPSEFISLNADKDDFVALWRPANVADPKGVIVLLPGAGESTDWPRGIGPLRRGLPDHGWHTLSLSLPDSPGLLLPPATEQTPEQPTDAPETETEQPSEDPPPSEAGYLPEEAAAAPGESAADDGDAQAPAETATPKPEPEQAEQITARIEAALAFARSRQPAAIVLLGQGTGGYWAARYLQQRAPADVRHLLVIQPRQPEGQDEPLAQLVPTLKLATGDFYYKDSGNEQRTARERLNASRRIQHPAYRQVGLPQQTGDRPSDQEALVRRVRGWLKREIEAPTGSR
ncbi:alpha/beta hydrolase family protein [Stutzerimonas stutzeri]|uniref:alpha/beta hydrolase family protein n=1 Tax=Stutzerimonas stutzeri TaxID=316 RepID=UPI00210CD798|nr:alpha/beta hydrolase family protein [Stutzerimonas stutzeri]MCQ4318731.1 alpha/beta hydrolase family protein [Stutzerimonas stutzeri]